MLYFERVSKEYENGNKVLDDISITVHKGELVSIVGHSGAGKTTLIKLLLAEEHPTEGNRELIVALTSRFLTLV